MKAFGRPIYRNVIFLLGLWGIAGVSELWADSEHSYNRIRLEADSIDQVRNDRMQAVLDVFGEDPDPVSLANRINQVMDWALRTAADYDNVQTKTGSYQIYPIHQKNIMRGWRGSQQLILVAGDFDQLGRLVGKLQERMQVKSMDFSLFPQTRTVAEDQLIYAALEKFKGRAELVRENLGAVGYRIVDLTIHTGGAVPRPVPMMRAQAAELESVAVPAVEGGESTVTVTVSGLIELE